MALSSLAAAALISAAPRPSPRPVQKPLVIFFGGYLSSQADMNAWVGAARRSTFGKTFDFQGIPYPANTSFIERDAVQANRLVIDALVGQIKASPDRTFIVAGHSSGGAPAAAVVEQAGSGRKNVRLVVLEDGVEVGFKAPPGFDASRQIECWSAVNGPSLKSFTRDQTKRFCTVYHEVQAATCRTAYCLHFAIVNLGVPADLTQGTAFLVAPNGTTGGYQNLRINLSWLPWASDL